MHVGVYLDSIYWVEIIVWPAWPSPPTPPPHPSICEHWTSTNSVSFYLFVYFLLSFFHFRGLLSETCKPGKLSGTGAQGSGYCVYDCALQDEIKIQIERKQRNHHFCYLLPCGLPFPLLTNSSRALKQKAQQSTRFMTHRRSLSNIINTWEDSLQSLWKSL